MFLATEAVVGARLHVRWRCCHSWRVWIWWLSSLEPGPEEDLDKVNVGGVVVLDKVEALLHADLYRPIQMEVELAVGELGVSHL